MKILEKDGVYQKVSNDFIAEDKVKKLGWKYSSRSEWKKNVRDVKKAVVEATPEDQKVAKKQRRENNKKIKI